MIIKAQIFHSEKLFDAKNAEIIKNGLSPYSLIYANKETCKYGDIWVMPVIPGVENFFDNIVDFDIPEIQLKHDI